MPCEESVVALVMAAGESRRFGSDKRRHRLADGRPILAATLQSLPNAIVRRYVVVRPEDDLQWLESPCMSDVTRLEAPHASHGLGASLGDAFTALLAQGDTALAAAVVLGDLPWLRPTSYAPLLRQADAARIVIPRQAGRSGHPVVFGRELWPELAALRTGEGARAIVSRHAQAITFVDMEDEGVWRDIDRPEDLTDRR